MSTDVVVLQLDIEAAVQTARLSSNRRYAAQDANMFACYTFLILPRNAYIDVALCCE